MTLGIAACLDSIEYNIQINVGRCLPQMWGFRVGIYGGRERSIRWQLSTQGTSNPTALVPCVCLSRIYLASVWLSCELTLPGTTSDDLSRRSEKSAYPSHIKANAIVSNATSG